MHRNVAKLVCWGVRGSIPTLDRGMWRYGGNTPCLDLTAPDGTRFVLDCGTGLRMLGNRWASTEGDRPLQAHVLVTHYHWDHIQGIPFFRPFYLPQNGFHFYSFQSKYLGRGSLRQVLEAQLARPYFPVDLSLMHAGREFSEITGGDQFEVNGTKVTARWLNHPQGCLGYRLETPAGTIVYATDNEPGIPEMDKNLRELAAGADVLINDAQCSPEQLASTRKGWGHSSWLEGVKLARECGVKNLVLFHHDPDSSDRVVDGYLYAARQEFPNTWAATDGMGIQLQDHHAEFKLRESRVGQRRPVHFSATVSGRSQDGVQFQEYAVLKELNVRGGYLWLSHSPQLQSQMNIRVDCGTSGHPNQIVLRASVVHCDVGRDKDRVGVGVTFIDDTEAALPLD
ncbi:MAG TPA: MBL fold metallo-hydrolase [Candidatus Limnocylindrales bacterium]|nr:MBL fold metallo-hydrolase [Candidatus Limnocylindrales bacterium]